MKLQSPGNPMLRLFLTALMLALAMPAALADLATGMLAYEKGNYVQAMEEFRPLAEQGNADAQYRLGLMYANGRGVARDYARAAEWYRRAAEQEHAQSRTNLGSLYFHGQGVDRDLQQALHWYRLAAEQGRAVAQKNLGAMYESGEGVDADPAEAARYYRLAAEQGHAGAQFALGRLHEAGRGVPQNDRKAARWFLKAAKQDHAAAQNRLAGFYAEGRGVKQNATKASDWYRAAAANGSTEAQENLSAFYAERGDLTPPRLADAAGVDAAESEEADAPANRAAKEATAALPAAAGDSVAPSELPPVQPPVRPTSPEAMTDRVDEIVSRDEAADPEALYQRGRRYARGLGVPKDEREAIRWYRQAARAGHDLAGYRVALLYLRGRGLEAPDFVQAHLWFSISAERGVGDAADWRDRIDRKLTKGQREESRRLLAEYLARDDP